MAFAPFDIYCRNLKCNYILPKNSLKFNKLFFDKKKFPFIYFCNLLLFIYHLIYYNIEFFIYIYNLKKYKKYYIK
jgi:hypothetical protein